jgi:hypothetical protein
MLLIARHGLERALHDAQYGDYAPPIFTILATVGYFAYRVFSNWPR